MSQKKIGAVMVLGGGIAGMQAALDAADSGYYVYLIEKSPSIGGLMSQLDKTFPTNDCAMCILSPVLVEVGRHINIELLTLSEVKNISGEEGNLEISLTQYPRYVDMDKCIACGLCSEKCPKKVVNDYDGGLSERKAIYVKYAQAVPLKYAIDSANCIYLTKGKCRACEKFCPSGAINFNDQAKDMTLHVGAIILAGGCETYDPKPHDVYGYGKSANVVTSLEFGRILSASGPYGGHLVRPSDKKEPKKIAWLQCVGSRIPARPYCSKVCCTHSIKNALQLKKLNPEMDVYILYRDMRSYGLREDLYRQAREKGIVFSGIMRIRPWQIKA
jgi:heterodisulfide reductase subunit A2